MNTKQTFLLIVLAAWLAGCATPVPGPQPTRSPLTSVSPLASPLAVSPSTGEVPFKLDRPLLEGATEIRGTGPANVPIYIADITFMGEPMGTSRIGPDGKFVITVSPLEAGHRLGLALGILTGTPWTPEYFYQQGFYGPDAMQFPQVGFFHDTVLVSKP